MGLQTVPYVVDGASHTAQLFREAAGSMMVADGSGVCGPGELVVSPQATPNMSVRISPGRFWASGSDLGTLGSFQWSTQGSYFDLSDSAVTVTIPTSNASNPRYDVVYARTPDASYSGSSSTPLFGVVSGAPNATPIMPALPSNAIALARVLVAANATNITAAAITDLRTYTVAVGGILPVAAGSQPTAGQSRRGMYIDDPTYGLMRWNGTYYAPVKQPYQQTYRDGFIVGSGVDAYDELTANAGEVRSIQRDVWSSPPRGVYRVYAKVNIAHPGGGNPFASHIRLIQDATGTIGSIAAGGNTLGAVEPIDVPSFKTQIIIERELTLLSGDISVTVALESDGGGVNSRIYRGSLLRTMRVDD